MYICTYMEYIIYFIYYKICESCRNLVSKWVPPYFHQLRELVQLAFVLPELHRAKATASQQALKRPYITVSTPVLYIRHT